MAYSPYTTAAVAFVRSHPGCCKYELAAHLTRSPRRDPSRQYYLVNTQVRLGNIRAERRGGRYALYVQ